MVEELLAHIPLHVGAHHVSLVADIVLAQGLYRIHEKQPHSDGNQSPQNRLGALPEEGPGEGAQNLGIGQIHKADDRRTDQIDVEDRLIRLVVADKFSQCIHLSSPLLFHIKTGDTLASPAH